MRIVLLATPDLAYPSGSTVFVSQFAKGLAERGHEVHILCRTIPEGCDQKGCLTFHSLDIPLDHPVQLNPSVSDRDLGRAIHSYAHAASNLTGPRTILHSMYATVTAMGGAYAARQANIPHVITTFGRDLGVGRVDERYSAMVAKTLSSATHVVAANAAVAEQAAPLLPKHKLPVTQIPMGVNHLLFGDQPGFVESRNRIGIEASRSVVLVVQSAFNRDKRLEVVLEALAGLNEPKALLVVVGRDDSQDRARERLLLRHALAYGVSDRIIWAGQQQHSLLPFYYGAANVFVDARATCSFSSCILEAMWAAVPVVATAASAASGTVPPDVLAAVVPTDDAPSLSRALSSILLDGRRGMALGRVGRQWIAVKGSANSIDSVVEAYEKVYKRALFSGTRRPCSWYSRG